MDPVTHTLVGAVVARSGLGRRTAMGTATCLLGANLPDVDVLAYAAGAVFPLAVRRGWTHGVLAMAVLPLVLTGLIVAWDRVVRRRRRPDVTPAPPHGVLLLAAASVVSHPLLDLLNVYGIRLLMPFDARWFYGDVLFIADPWIWVLLGGAVLLPRRGAKVALAAAGLYVLGMATSTVAARRIAWRSVPFARAGIERIMVAPEPLTPFVRWVVLDAGDHYRVGTFDWLATPKMRYEDLVVVPRGETHAAVAAARRRAEAAWFLTWARFPFFRVDDTAHRTWVHLIDARYALEPDAGFGALRVEVERP